MRITISLNDYLYSQAKSMAKADGISMSAAISMLMRRALERNMAPSAPVKNNRGIPVVRCDRSFTSEDVARLEDAS